MSKVKELEKLRINGKPLTMREMARWSKIDFYRRHYDELPDGAFFALAEDSFGIDVDDWAWFSQVKKSNK